MSTPRLLNGWKRLARFKPGERGLRRCFGHTLIVLRAGAAVRVGEQRPAHPMGYKAAVRDLRSAHHTPKPATTPTLSASQSSASPWRQPEAF